MLDALKSIIIGFMFAGLFGWLGYEALGMWKQQLRNEQINSCAQFSKVQYEQEGKTIIEVGDYWYQKCLKNKGVK